MKRKAARPRDDMSPEYDLDYSKGIRGKYHARLLKEGSNVVVLDPDVAQRFRTSAAVNDALRKLLKQTRPRPHSSARPIERRRSRSSTD